jgi:hypothetical protein
MQIDGVKNNGEKCNPIVQGSCYRYAIGCPMPVKRENFVGRRDIDSEPPGMYESGVWDFVCNCSSYMDLMRSAGLTDPDEANSIMPEPRCSDGYLIAVYYLDRGDPPCSGVDGGRHFRRQEKDGSWKEMFAPNCPSSVPWSRLEQDILIGNGRGAAKLQFCGYLCRGWNLTEFDLIDHRDRDGRWWK